MAEKELTAKNFDQITSGDKPVLVDFWAPWCGPCQMMAPIVEEITKEQKKITIGKLNIDDHPEVAEKFHVMSVPTFLIFKSGQVTGQIVGAVSKDVLTSLIEKVIKD